jgi:hypothetical protein
VAKVDVCTIVEIAVMVVVELGVSSEMEKFVDVDVEVGADVTEGTGDDWKVEVVIVELDPPPEPPPGNIVSLVGYPEPVPGVTLIIVGVVGVGFIPLLVPAGLLVVGIMEVELVCVCASFEDCVPVVASATEAVS